MTVAAREVCEPRSTGVLALLGVAAVLVLTVLTGLGTWQVQRLGWKLALIDRVDRRVRASPVEAPDARSFDPAADEYRHVRVSGTFLVDRSTDVLAVTAYGSGFWVLAPLRRQDGSIVLVNRGFAPADKRDPAGWGRPNDARDTTVTGLLRLTEPNGAFLRRNDPTANRWFSRDVAAIAAARSLDRVAPYFIDAEPGPPGTLPIGGLTVTTFPNNHLVYALTWYTLAAMLAGAMLWVARDEWRLRHRSAG